MKLQVGKEYNLNNVIEIKVTNEFLDLEKDVIGCQNDESYDDCNTRHYIEKLHNHCGCLPFTIRNSEKACTGCPKKNSAVAFMLISPCKLHI